MQHQVVLYKDGTVSCHLERYNAQYGVDVMDRDDYLGVCHNRPRPGGKQNVVAVSAGAQGAAVCSWVRQCAAGSSGV